MQKIFSKLVDSFIDSKVGVTEDFLTSSLAINLKKNLLELYAGHQFRNAGIGNERLVRQDQLIRSDQIYWLDRKHNNSYENSFFDCIDRFVIYLNDTCYAGITGYEFHYALYENGSFYKKHLDQFKTDGSRKYSMIIYLNADWKESDGGELCIHHADHLQMVNPLNRTCVFFKSSELEHEVLLTNTARMSITGWLKV
ncbi:proline hydroxylase [Pedobacter sp. HMWF019]|uniref:2OG-Fe(II) oxygenase n=1 Tax=Pedobacter sp. HMWF019 TaxID=2056856 RepID=UPI000D3CC49C|nr:2OG-Fe(II) oxygenase [Pedobacter sp. HMWF019]PTS94826.1 proline hydroxylase [Pedobacter sp. HMWF019]